MLIKVELAPEVVEYLRKLSDDDRDDFIVELDKRRVRPIEQSNAFFDDEISGYLLRSFEFGVGARKIAIFAFHPIETRIRVIRCRLKRPRKDAGENR